MDSIVVKVGGQEFYGILAHTEAAREFTQLLPLRLSMEELNGNEKYAYLDYPLSADPRNPGIIHIGDIMLFGGSCLVLFYEAFPTPFNYTPIARLSDVEGLVSALGAGDVDVEIDFRQS